jgi:hypothetical protein
LIKRTKEKKVSKGFQCVALTTSDGFLINFEFDKEFTGEDKFPYLNRTQNRVMRITKLLVRNKYASLYLDNRFSSAFLFYYLFYHRFAYATGTWRKNFGVPKMIQLKKSAKNSEIQAMKNRGVQLCQTKIRPSNNPTFPDVTIIGLSFYDNSPVYLLTTANYEFNYFIGGKKNQKRLDITHDYNSNMHGNDIADGLLVAFTSYIRSRKYWVRLFHFLLDCGINNAYLLNRILASFDNITLEHIQFYLNLVDQLFQYCNELRDEFEEPREKKSSDHLKGIKKNNINQHFHERIHSEEVHLPSISNTRGRCKLCSINGHRSEINVYCEQCQVHLCLNANRNCYKQFHTLKRL